MPRLMEHSHRHGPFDPRFRLRRSTPATVVASTAGHAEIAGWEDNAERCASVGTRVQPRAWS